MLRIQRASAGSGKTYTLAREFIFHLIAFKNKQGVWHLRNKHQIEDALSKILAITFTNKATNEMKQRIVDKLARLSLASDNKNITAAYIKDTDYLTDFCKLLNASYQQVGIASHDALNILINNFSSFRISTIDSFFQEILRTFAFEANLNDSYQLEIDSEYINKAALDITLNEFESETKNPETNFWIRILIDRMSKINQKWNPFSKSDSKNSVYNEIKSSLKNLENEEFKSIRDELVEFLDNETSSVNLKKLYLNLQNNFNRKRTELFNNIQQCLAKADYIKETLNIPDEAINKTFLGKTLPNLRNLKRDAAVSPVKIKDQDSYTSKINSKYKTTSAIDYDVPIREIYGYLYEWDNCNEVIAWKIYGDLLPYLGLIFEINRQLNKLLENNNQVQLSDTNFLLKKIIGEDDTPFVYERIGTFIENYLIDEFQDTSAMQWEVLKPLLEESVSKDLDSLIIGDPKQSIYRFRNADSTLITNKVPDSFPNHKAAGDSKEDNTNWRSSKLIVEFNNLFFHILAKKIKELSENKGNGVDFSKLYGNVIQYPNKQTDYGYVEIRFLELPKNDNAKNDESADSQDEIITNTLAIIEDLLNRGYRQKDIGILVNKNNQAAQIIAGLVDYNSSHPRPIEFLSEESLLISSSPAVEMIISVIEKISDGGFLLNKEINSEEESLYSQSTKISWEKIKVNFYYYYLNHPDLSLTDLVVSYLKEEDTDKSLKHLIKKMQSPTLPSIVEAVAATFLPADIKNSQAIFIAAFQDLVIEYCEKFSSDPASFIEWWKAKGMFKSITSPEDSDAVQIMTIHKAKGLEFKCVIIPFAYDSMTPVHTKAEWRWVKPSLCTNLDLKLPPYLPVKTSSLLLSAEPYADIYKKYFDDVLMDRLNNYYVAFTRAIDELYILSKNTTSESGTSISFYLQNICSDMEDRSDLDQSIEINWVIDTKERFISEDKRVITFGNKPITANYPENKEKNEEVINGNDDGYKLKEKPDGISEIILKDYFVNDSLPILHFVESESPESISLIDEDEDPNPRSEGNLLHAIMSKISVSSDLDKALLFAKSRGWISLSQLEYFKEFLYHKLMNPEVSDWFSGKWQVMNERSVFSSQKTKRPDRIMLSGNGLEAIVIDYKFGNSHNEEMIKKYRRQIKNYISVIQDAVKPMKITGYIWYVKDDKIIEIS